MRQETAIGVLTRLKKEFCPNDGAKRLIVQKYKFCNKVKIVFFFPDLSVIFVDNFVSHNRKVYSEPDLR